MPAPNVSLAFEVIATRKAKMKEKQVKALRRKARQLGLEVVEKTSDSVPAATAAPVQG